MTRILRHRHASRLLGALLLLTFVATAPALARHKKVAFVDDDWEPVERRTYLDDPGYENWIVDALNAEDIEFDWYEVQQQGMPPQLPLLSELADHQLVLWDCGAETEGAMGYDERALIRAYRNLGGKVLLFGQGILNSLDAELAQNPGDPEIIDFIENHLGVSEVMLDIEVVELLPPTYVPYMSGLPPTSLDYSDLPDTDPALVDAITPMPGVDTILDGLLPFGGYVSVSTTTFLPAPLHFQTVLPHAIDSPQLRGQWLLGTMETVGYQGFELMDFMLGSEYFGEAFDCPPSWIGWDSGPNAMGFEAWGSSTCSEIWSMDLFRNDDTCFWELGFSHVIQSVSHNSEMILMELGTASNSDFVRIRAQTNAGSPYQYDLEFKVKEAGAVIQIDGHEGLNLGETYRIMFEQSGDPLNLGVWVYDHLGMVVAYFEQPNFNPVFSKLRMRTVPHGVTVDGPTIGWIDDIFLEGCLDFTPTASDPAPAARAALNVHPNPFNPSTAIAVDLPRAGEVTVAVHDMSGRRIRTLAEGWRDAGSLDLSWDGRDEAGRGMGSGVYLVRVVDVTGERGAKAVLLK